MSVSVPVNHAQIKERLTEFEAANRQFKSLDEVIDALGNPECDTGALRGINYWFHYNRWQGMTEREQAAELAESAEQRRQANVYPGNNR